MKQVTITKGKSGYLIETDEDKYCVMTEQQAIKMTSKVLKGIINNDVEIKYDKGDDDE